MTRYSESSNLREKMLLLARRASAWREVLRGRLVDGGLTGATLKDRLDEFDSFVEILGPESVVVEDGVLCVLFPEKSMHGGFLEGLFGKRGKTCPGIPDRLTDLELLGLLGYPPG